MAKMERIDIRTPVIQTSMRIKEPVYVKLEADAAKQDCTINDVMMDILEVHYYGETFSDKAAKMLKGK